MRWALVFSGQGSQHGDMLPWLADDVNTQRISEALGADWRQQLDRPGLRADNRRSQLLLTGTGCAAWQQLKPLVEEPAIVAGYSVGELAAFAATDVLDAATAWQLAGLRADCMDAAAAGTDTGLLALGGVPLDGIAGLCVRHGLEVAIRIDPAHAIVGGPRSALNTAAIDAAARGWRATALNVALASHTRWMTSAVDTFARHLEAVEICAPARPLVTNALGRVRDATSARLALSRQLAQTVRWDVCMDLIAAQGVRAVLEVGPGQSLARMWNERFTSVPARSADEFHSARAVADWLQRTLAQ